MKNQLPIRYRTKILAKKSLACYRRILRFCLGLTQPEKLARKIHYCNLKRPLNLDNPKDLNEKINWLKFRADTKLWIELADKYRVRDYVIKLGLGHLLVDCYGAWNHVNKINFQKLPSRFVLKPNNACGMVILVRDKTTLDYNATRKTLQKWLSQKYYGVDSAVLHYHKIPPLILAEAFLEESMENRRFSCSLIDYKIWCFHGKPYCLLICYDRTASSLKLNLYDTKWQSLANHLVPGNNYQIDSHAILRPAGLNKMLEYAEILSAGFPQVRVDFYNVGEKIYFGELTFTSAAGYMNYFSHDFLLELGNKVHLP